MERTARPLGRVSGSVTRSDVTASGTYRDTGERSLVRLVLVATLLLAEGILFGIRFEGPARGTEWWSVLLSQASNIVRFGIAGVAGSILLGGRQLLDRLRIASAESSRSRRPWLLLLGHAVVLLGFFRLTAYVIEGDLHASAFPSVWVAAWLGVGALAAMLAIAIALPARAVPRTAVPGAAATPLRTAGAPSLSAPPVAFPAVATPPAATPAAPAVVRATASDVLPTSFPVERRAPA